MTTITRHTPARPMYRLVRSSLSEILLITENTVVSLKLIIIKTTSLILTLTVYYSRAESSADLALLCLTSMCLSIHNFINTGLNYLLFPTLCDYCVHPLIIGLFSIICQGRLTSVSLVFFPRNMGPVSPIFHGTLSVAETLLSTLFPLMTGTNFVLVLKIS